MKKTLRVGLYVGITVLALAGGYNLVSSGRAFLHHVAQDHLNQHIVDAIIDANIKAGKLDIPPELRPAEK
jgi:hypothetical protein